MCQHSAMKRKKVVRSAKRSFKEVQQQMHALYEFNDDPLLMPLLPEGFDDDKQYEFKLRNIMVMARDGLMMTVPALLWVMDHLPKYKAGGIGMSTMCTCPLTLCEK